MELTEGCPVFVYPEDGRGVYRGVLHKIDETNTSLIQVRNGSSILWERTSAVEPIDVTAPRKFKSPQPEPTVFSAAPSPLDVLEESPLGVAEWQECAHALAVAKGWYENRDGESPDCHIAMLALVAGEVHEAIEEVRNGGRVHYTGDGGKPEGVGIELADVLLRVFDYAEFCGIDLEEMLRVKFEYNKTRKHRHGGRLA